MIKHEFKLNDYWIEFRVDNDKEETNVILFRNGGVVPEGQIIDQKRFSNKDIQHFLENFPGVSVTREEVEQK